MPALTAAISFRIGEDCDLLFLEQFLAGNRHRQTRACDRRGAGAAIGLQDVAIDPHRARSEFFQINHAAQRSSDQSLNFRASPIQSSLGDVALLSRGR